MKQPKHILVIRLSALGDVAMTIPVLRVFTQTYPTIKLTVISRAYYKPLFDGIPNLTFLEADVYGKHKGLGLMNLAKEAKKLGIDAVADLHSVIRSKAITRYLNFSGITKATINKGRAEKKDLTRDENKIFKPLKSTHQRYADVFETLGLPLDLSTHQFPKKKSLIPKLSSFIGVEPKKLIGIAPFAAYKSKMYPRAKMTEVIKKLDAANKYQILLFGGGGEEKAILQEVESQFKNVNSSVDLFTFEEELALISNLDIMLSMDSGNGHLAALFGIPTITLWGVTHPYAGFAPFLQPDENQLLADRAKFPLIPTSIYGNKFPKAYENAITTISPEMIIENVLRII